MHWRGRAGFLQIPFLILIGVFVVIVVIGGVSYYKYKDAKTIVPVPPDACKCKDVEDMANRIAEAEAAIARYTQMITAIMASDAAAGKPTMFSADQHARGEASVQTDVNGAHKAGATSGSGQTDSACVTTVKSGSECIRASLQSHENLHSASCQGAKASGRVGKYDDYKMSMTMADYWREEIAAYGEEIKYLTEALARIKTDPTCKPVAEATSPGGEDKEAVAERQTGAFDRVAAYVAALK